MLPGILQLSIFIAGGVCVALLCFLRPPRKLNRCTTAAKRVVRRGRTGRTCPSGRQSATGHHRKNRLTTGALEPGRKHTGAMLGCGAAVLFQGPRQLVGLRRFISTCLRRSAISPPWPMTTASIRSRISSTLCSIKT